MNLLLDRINSFRFTLLSTLIISGCTIKYVADYDSSIQDEIVELSKKVDLFWVDLLDAPTNERQYEKFKSRYNEIEVDIRSLVLRNEIRPLNSGSIYQANEALDLWLKDKEKHKQEDGFSDYIAERRRMVYLRTFTAMAKGEEAKNN